MKTEPLYIVKVHVPKFYDFSWHSIEYFMTKNKQRKNFKKKRKNF